MAALTTVAATPVQAQAPAAGAATLDRYSPGELPHDGLVLSRPGNIGHMQWAAQLHVDYANQPLVYERELGDAGSQAASIVDHHLVAHAGAAFGLFDRLLLHLSMPVSLVMVGDTIPGQPAANGSSLGDLAFGVRVRLVGEDDDIGALSVQARGTLPLAEWIDDDQHFAGDRKPTASPELVAELRPGPVQITLNAGATFRAEADFGNTVIDDELTYGLGVGFPIWQQLRGYVEGWGSTSLRDFATRESSPIDVLGGVKYLACDGWVAGAGIGAGVTGGYGSPRLRATVMGGYAMPSPVCRDRDGDGLVGKNDRCPERAEDRDGYEDTDGCPDPDNDGDGVLDRDDRCPNEPGSAEHQGCPNPDSDGDGIVDLSDQCPDKAEDKDGFEDEDGCPDPDNDGDGVLDADDRCPDEPGKAEFQGCPPPDRDGDGVLDHLDNCPDEPGPAANQGCKSEQLVKIEGAQLRILDKVYFATGKARLQKRSYPLLANIAAVVNAHPEIDKVRVEGHTDSVGSDRLNERLSQRRAEAVVTFLMREGVGESRLEAVGKGEAEPLESNKSALGRATNRRVEFHIVQNGKLQDGEALDGGMQEPPASADAEAAPVEQAPANP